jgi:hypothetical protein
MQNLLVKFGSAVWKPDTTGSKWQLRVTVLRGHSAGGLGCNKLGAPDVLIPEEGCWFLFANAGAALHVQVILCVFPGRLALCCCHVILDMRHNFARKAVVVVSLVILCCGLTTEGVDLVWQGGWAR